MHPFWKALETLPGHQAIEVTWRDRLGSDWTWAVDLTTPAAELATVYPGRVAEGMPPAYYDIVCHDEAAEDFVGVNEDRTARVALRRADLIVYEVDPRLLSRRIAAALGLKLDPEVSATLPAGCFRVGWMIAEGLTEIPVYLCVPHEGSLLRDAMARIALQHRGRFVVLTNYPVATTRKAVVVSVDEAISIDRAGVMSAGLGFKRWLKRLRKSVGHAAGDGVSSPTRFTFGGVQYDSPGLTSHEVIVLDLLLRRQSVAIERLMHRTHGLIYKQRYSPKSRDKLAQFLARLNRKVQDARPTLFMQLRIRGEQVVRVVRADRR